MFTRSVHALALLILCTVLAWSPPASARGAACLAADPAAAGDAAALDAVRVAVDAACPCATFTGAPGAGRKEYLKCAKAVLKAAVVGGQVRKPCTGVATYPVVRSTCGYPAELGRTPCVLTSRSGKVSCKIASGAACAKSQGLACADYTNCRDAADTNHDLLVGAGDAGTCNPLVACLNPPRPDGTACEDGDACTHDDVCTAHACGGTAYTCTPDVCQASGTCNGDGTCTFAAKPDGTTCDAGVDAKETRVCTDGSCNVCTPSGTCSVTTTKACAFDVQCPSGETCSFASAPAPRFVENGDGTVTDRHTCLVWEKKGHADGELVVCPGAATCSDPHDADNVYAWSSTFSSPDGPVFTDFLAALNGSGFAGHANWRLPRTDIAPELQSIVDLSAAGCGSGAPCTPAALHAACTPTCSGTDPSCSCTAPTAYSSAAWNTVVDFATGAVPTVPGTTARAARAVRGCMQTPLVLPSYKAACFNTCAIDCRNDGQCIFGCMVGQDYDEDRCYADCVGFAPACLDFCLQTITCIQAKAALEICP